METAAQKAKKLADDAKKLANDAQNAVKQNEIPENAQKIKILRPHHEYSYFAGDEPALAPEHAALLVAGGYAELVVEAETA
ncbi:MAG: hypothetical protein ACRYFZ_00745 [Janthinobacterium lividum]